MNCRPNRIFKRNGYSAIGLRSGAQLAALFACFVTAPLTVAQTSASVFEGARLISGDGNLPIEDSVLVVRNGRIVQVGRKSSVKLPKGATRVDLSGKTIMPLLIDVHGHAGYMRGGTISKENYSRANILDQLRRLQYYGVGAMASLGTGRDDVELQIRNDQSSGAQKDPNLALLFTANDGIVPYNGGNPNGGPAFADDVVHEAANPEQAREFVRREAAKKVDFIKFWNDDRNRTKPKMPAEIYYAIIDEARKHKVPVVAHTFYLDDAKDVARAGVGGLAHPVRDKLVDEEFLRFMKQHKVFQCSNVSSMAPRSWLDAPDVAETVPSDVIESFKTQSGAATNATSNAYSIALKNLKIESDSGIRIVLCGDTAGVPGQFPGISEHRELEALAEAGISPLEVIRAATKVSAEVLNLSDAGSLSVGKRADFIVLDSNPLENMSNTRKISAIYKNGKPVDRASLRKQIAQASAQ